MRALLLAVALAVVAAAPAPAAYDENRNWLNAYGRTVDHLSAPDRAIGTALLSAQNALTTLTRDGDRIPERGLQQTGAWPWSGDARRGTYDTGWSGRKVEFTFENGAGQTLAATAWAPSPKRLRRLKLPAPLPGIVYAPGVISSQPMYHWFAQDMADAGYVVMTYDLTGQGRSEGQRTTDHVRDLRAALDTFVSDAFPLRALLDVERIGTAGHSLGASAVQAVGSHGGLVKAISAHSDMQAGYSADVPLQGQGADYESFVLPPQPTPGSDPAEKLQAFEQHRKRGIDVQEVVIESGTHMAWSHVTWAYTSVWSEPVALWYSLAWFDRYLHDDLKRRDGVPHRRGVSATRRLTSSYEAIPGHGLSKKYRSAYDIAGVGACDDMLACRPKPAKRRR